VSSPHNIPPVDTEWEPVRDWVQHQPPHTPPETVRVELMQRVKALRPALFSPPLALKIWGTFLALWIFGLLAWLWTPGPSLSWTCEPPCGVGFVIYRQVGADFLPIGYVPVDPDKGGGSYTFVDAYYLPRQATLTYLVAVQELNGVEADRVIATLPAWPVWLEYGARILFSLSGAAFVVNWLHWRSLHHVVKPR